MLELPGLFGSVLLGSVDIGLRDCCLVAWFSSLLRSCLSCQHVISIGLLQISAKSG